MNRIMLLAALLLAAVQGFAGNVDPVTARATASRFMSQTANMPGRFMAPGMNADLRLIHTEMNTSDNSQAVYYIFNTSDSYIIVSGDDRAEAVLAYGDRPLDMNKIPAPMKMWLKHYKEQVEFLQANPGLTVPQPAHRAPATYGSVEPLLTALWDQGTPYNLYCPEVNGRRSVTGCGATSLSMIFYYWKFPTDSTPSFPSYFTYEGYTVSALTSTKFDWDNMIDVYRAGRYNEEQAHAVATLMRYVGHAEKMNYSPNGSSVTDPNILRAVKTYGYDENSEFLYKYYYTAAQWADYLRDELYCGRPVLYTAADEKEGGHAFNVDGYDAATDMYHINWGWSGEGNCYCAIDAFYTQGMLYDVAQAMIIGLEPPTEGPTIKAPNQLHIETLVDHPHVSTLYVYGKELTQDVYITLNDPSGAFSIDVTRLSVVNINKPQAVNITFDPLTSGESTATLTLKSAGAEDLVVTLQGIGRLETYVPTLQNPTDITNSSFKVKWKDNTPDHNVQCYNLEYVATTYREQKIYEGFDKEEYTGSTTQDWSSKLDQITNQPGWTGSKIYRGPNYITLGSNSAKGWLQTPAMDMTGNEGKITVKVNGNSTGSYATAPLIITVGDVDSIINVNQIAMEHSVLMPCPSTEDVKVTFTGARGVRVVINSIDIYAGDAHHAIDYSNAKYVYGIIGSSYTFKDIKPDFYALRLQGEYTDGTTSAWSNLVTVNMPFIKGDVNSDGEVNLADINTLIDIILSDSTEGVSLRVTDVNGDGEINLADINTVIDMILNG